MKDVETQTEKVSLRTVAVNTPRPVPSVKRHEILVKAKSEDSVTKKHADNFQGGSHAGLVSSLAWNNSSATGLKAGVVSKQQNISAKHAFEPGILCKCPSMTDVSNARSKSMLEIGRSLSLGQFLVRHLTEYNCIKSFFMLL